MIKEALTYLTTRPRLKTVKPFGHLTESIAILAREGRCQKYWWPHRRRCQDFIKEGMKSAGHHRSVLVLGAGPLHEIPIEELSATFQKVVLVDILHLKSTRKKVAHLKNLEFIEHDISELEGELSSTGKLTSKIPERFLDEDWGLVLSVNLMSQIPLHLETFITKRWPEKKDTDETKNYLNGASAHHLAYLESFSSPVVLITDTHSYYLDKDETLLYTDENFPHLKLPAPQAEWTWDVAPIPEFQKDVSIKMRVAAFVLKSKTI